MYGKLFAGTAQAIAALGPKASIKTKVRAMKAVKKTASSRSKAMASTKAAKAKRSKVIATKMKKPSGAIRRGKAGA